MKGKYYIHDIGWSDCGIKSVDAFGVAVSILPWFSGIILTENMDDR